MSSRGRQYVHEGGILSRDPSTGYRSYRAGLSRFVEWKRVAMILIPALVLFVTNPANGILSHYLSFSSSDWIGRPGVTNFGIYSLEATAEGVAISALLTRSDVLCPFYDPAIGAFCGSFADSVCHQKPFFPWEYPPLKQYFKRLLKHGFDSEDLRDSAGDFLSALAVDRVYVVHRIICALLIGSAVWNICCPRFPPIKHLVFGSKSNNNGGFFLPLMVVYDLWTSIFSHSRAGTNLVRDLVNQNIYVYPALVEVNRIVPKLRMTSWLVRPFGNETADYMFALVLLVVVLGAFSNLLAARIIASGRTIVGFSSTSAVALGYLVRNTSSSGRILGTFRRRDVSYAHAFWSNAAWMFIYEDWYPRLVVWMIAGLAGSVYAEFHHEHVEIFGVKHLLGFFGLA